VNERGCGRDSNTGPLSLSAANLITCYCAFKLMYARVCVCAAKINVLNLAEPSPVLYYIQSG